MAIQNDKARQNQGQQRPDHEVQRDDQQRNPQRPNKSNPAGQKDPKQDQGQNRRP